MQDYKGELFSAFQRLLPQHTLSRLTAKLAESNTPWLKDTLIRQFIRAFKVDMKEALQEDLSEYENFNDFFIRHLKPGLRPVNSSPNMIACPADGTISQIGHLDSAQLIQAKGITYSAEKLLGNSDEARQFAGGSFATIYLSPKDYHRVHMPITGTLRSTRYIPGKLFSVNGATTNSIPNLFARNERLICTYDTEAGTVAVVMVGAMLVAGIGTVWCPQYQPNPETVMEDLFVDKHRPSLKKGAEMGYFNFGSTVIVLFERNTVEWAENIQNNSTVRMGEAIGRLNKNGPRQ